MTTTTETITATLSLLRWNPRGACLEINGPGMFIGASIEIGREYGGTFASKERIAELLLEAAQSRANFEAKTHGFPAPVVAWEV